MKKLILIFLVMFCSLLLISCEKDKEYKGTIYAFDTTIEIKIKANKKEVKNIYNHVSDTFKNYHKLTSSYDDYGNNVYAINHSNDFVEVDNDLIELLNICIIYQDKTNGFFNPLMGNITSIYKDIINKKDTSKLSKIDEELSNLNNTKIIIDGNKVKLDGAAKLDLGAIAKGYALEKVRCYLKEQGVKYYLINAGYSSISMGEKDGNYFRVGLKYDESRIVLLKNTSISSSSLNEQQVEVDGVKYHHIVNPKNGKNEFMYSSVYVLNDDACLLDAYSTAFFNMKLDDIKNLCEKENIKVIVYGENNILYESEGIMYA